MSPHLFVDISSHGFGHLAQVAPVLDALFQQLPGLRLTIRCGLPEEKLRTRIRAAFDHLAGASDFGFVMHDAVRVDVAATARQYREFHAEWPRQVAAETRLLERLQPDLVLTDVAYLPLAAAVQLKIPALSMCSLNWADLFVHFFGNEAWAAPIHAEILAAYRSAEIFLRLTPAMPMPDLPNTLRIAPVAGIGIRRHDELLEKIGSRERTVLVAFGGIDCKLPIEGWPVTPGIRWLIPQGWAVCRDDMTPFEPLGLAFTDLLASVDAVLTKPGYGTFAEAACNGTPVLYQRRDDWPEQDCLIDWLKANARCLEVPHDQLSSGHLRPALEELWQQSVPLCPVPDGAEAVARLVHARLVAECKGGGSG